jgi:hypothetical protein
MKMKAGTSSHPANSGVLRPLENGRRSAVVLAVVLTVSVEVAEVAPVAMVVEEGEQLAPDGIPAGQDSITVPLKLFFPVTTNW